LPPAHFNTGFIVYIPIDEKILSDEDLGSEYISTD